MKTIEIALTIAMACIIFAVGYLLGQREGLSAGRLDERSELVKELRKQIYPMAMPGPVDTSWIE